MIKNISEVHCLFEQHGTFKNTFKRFGIQAFDYDLQNKYSETDFVCDLFAEIENGFNCKQCIFDKLNASALIFAFFPCVYFCDNNTLYFNGTHRNLKKLADKEKFAFIIQRAEKRNYYYLTLLKLISIVKQRGLRLIIENPYGPNTFLLNNIPYDGILIDRNRQQRGDYFKKPTQFLTYNCTLTNYFSYSPGKIKKKVKFLSGNVDGFCGDERSEISEAYAKNFVLDNVLRDPGSAQIQLSLKF